MVSVGFNYRKKGNNGECLRMGSIKFEHKYINGDIDPEF